MLEECYWAVLRQRHNKILHLIYYASKTLNGAQINYTVTEQELLAIVYAFEKFRTYLFGVKGDSLHESCRSQLFYGKEGRQANVD